VPRLINQICDSAMMTGAKRKEKQIESSLIRELAESGSFTHAVAASDSERGKLVIEQVKKEPEPYAEEPELEAELVQEKVDGFDVLDLGQLAIN